MNGLSKLIDSLEIKFFKLSHKLVQLENSNKELLAKIKVSENIQKKQLEKIENLEEEIANLKMVNSLLGSEENKRETKLKINSLIREIDYCIAQLSD